jgi:hypothetical protein
MSDMTRGKTASFVYGGEYLDKTDQLDITSETGAPVEDAATCARHPVPFDIVCFGILMILSGIFDIAILVAYPQYSLPFFGGKLAGMPGILIKAIQPLIHFVSGYGAIYGRRWAYPFFMAYAVYGMANAVTNRLLLPPPHRIRTIFMIGTVLVMGYLYCRRRQFRNKGL